MDSRICCEEGQCVWIMRIPDLFSVTGIWEWMHTVRHGSTSAIHRGWTRPNEKGERRAATAVATKMVRTGASAPPPGWAPNRSRSHWMEPSSDAASERDDS